MIIRSISERPRAYALNGLTSATKLQAIQNEASCLPRRAFRFYRARADIVTEADQEFESGRKVIDFHTLMVASPSLRELVEALSGPGALLEFCKRVGEDTGYAWATPPKMAGLWMRFRILEDTDRYGLSPHNDSPDTALAFLVQAGADNDHTVGFEVLKSGHLAEELSPAHRIQPEPVINKLFRKFVGDGCEPILRRCDFKPGRWIGYDRGSNTTLRIDTTAPKVTLEVMRHHELRVRYGEVMCMPNPNFIGNQAPFTSAVSHGLLPVESKSRLVILADVLKKADIPAGAGRMFVNEFELWINLGE